MRVEGSLRIGRILSVRSVAVLALAGASVLGSSGASSASSSFPAPGTAPQIASLVAKSHLIKSLPANLDPSLGSLGQDSFSHYYPSTGPYGCVTTTQCVFADTHSSKSVVLYGDSHAAMWLSALIPAVTAAHERLVLLWYPFCPTANVKVWNPLTRSPNVQCGTYRTKFAGMIHALDPRLVLLADRTSGNRNYSNKEISDAAWKAGEIETIKNLRSSTTRVAVIGDISVFSSNVANCMAANQSNVQRCSVGNPSPKKDQHFAAERAAATSQNVPYINAEQWLCTSTCSSVVGNFAVFFDQFHVSATYAAFLSGVFASALKKLL